MLIPKISIVFFLAFFFTVVNCQPAFLGQSNGPGAEVIDENCFHDPSCHRNVTACLYQGCCSHKKCIPNKGCTITTPTCAEPVDNATCLHDSGCRRNVTVCPFANCCSFKRCPFDDGTCLVMLAKCEVPKELSADEICLYDKNCKRSVRICYSQDCCSVKECDENAECTVNIPSCKAQIDQQTFRQMPKPRKILGLKTNKNYAPQDDEP